VVKAVQEGDLSSLNVFGSPERTNDIQYAISSRAKLTSAALIGANVVVPSSLRIIQSAQNCADDRGMGARLTSWMSL
jgi:hypothetical protein